MVQYVPAIVPFAFFLGAIVEIFIIGRLVSSIIHNYIWRKMRLNMDAFLRGVSDTEVTGNKFKDVFGLKPGSGEKITVAAIAIAYSDLKTLPPPKASGAA
jgi:hypothetical protein